MIIYTYNKLFIMTLISNLIGGIMANKGPKTARGAMRKMLTGDGRKNLDTAVSETLFGKKKTKKK